MQTLTFTYTKPNQDPTDRVLMVITSPSDKYTGIDLTELEPTKAARFVVEYEALHDEFMNKVKELQASFDLRFAFKQFLEDRMSDVIKI